MSLHLRCAVVAFVVIFASIAMPAQAPPQLFWALNITPGGVTGYSNMIWFDLDGLPGPDPIPASPSIPLPAGAWTSEGGEWWTDAVQAPGQPAVFLVLTTGYGGELRAFRTLGGSLQPCGSYSLGLLNGENGGIRVSPSRSFAAVIVGANPQGYGSDMMLTFPLDLTVPHAVNGPCLLTGTPTRFPVPNNTAIRNVDFNPNKAEEVVITGYSNVVTFMNPITGVPVCNLSLVNNSQALTRLEARYNPAGDEVWVSSYDGHQIAIVKPPPDCSVADFITNGFGAEDGLAGGSFHPDSSVGVYYVGSYRQNTLYAIDTVTRQIAGSVVYHAAIGATGVAHGQSQYLLEVPIAGCCPQFSRTDTFDVTTSVQARNLSDLLGSHSSGLRWGRIATLRNVSLH